MMEYNESPDYTEHEVEPNARLLIDRSVHSEGEDSPQEEGNRWQKARILTGFWLLGLCNNFAYVVMLSAAYDILESQPDGQDGCNTTSTNEHHLICNKVGTGAILMADIVPSLLIKIAAPFCMHRISYNIRVVVCLMLGAASFVIVALAGSEAVWLSIIGVICASAGSGLGETVFLSFSSHFTKHSVSTWASGTGAAGVFGSIAYSGLTQIGLTPKATLYVMLVIPLIEGVSFFWLIIKPPMVQGWKICREQTSEYRSLINGVNDGALRPSHNFSVKDILYSIPPLLKYMVPLVLVYLGEYFINQSLFELLYFDTECSWLTIKAQYRWFQTIYQVGVFLSRSSVGCFKVRQLWLLPILQFGNVAILLFQVIYHYMPMHHGIWIVFALILWEGLLGGTGYVNTFYRISEEIPGDRRELSMSIVTCSDSLGVIMAAFASIQVHNSLCSLDIKW